MVHDTMWRKLLDVLPHGYNMAEEDFRRRHRLMLWVLGVHVPALVALGLTLGYAPRTLVYVAITPVVAVTLGYMVRRHRRTAPRSTHPDPPSPGVHDHAARSGLTVTEVRTCRP